MGMRPARMCEMANEALGSGKIKEERRKARKRNPKWKGNDFHFLCQPDTTRRRRDRPKKEKLKRARICGTVWQPNQTKPQKKNISRNVKILICTKKVCHHGSHTMQRNCMAFASKRLQRFDSFCISFFSFFCDFISFCTFEDSYSFVWRNAAAILLDL